MGKLNNNSSPADSLAQKSDHIDEITSHMEVFDVQDPELSDAERATVQFVIDVLADDANREELEQCSKKNGGVNMKKVAELDDNVSPADLAEARESFHRRRKEKRAEMTAQKHTSAQKFHELAKRMNATFETIVSSDDGKKTRKSRQAACLRLIDAMRTALMDLVPAFYGEGVVDRLAGKEIERELLECCERLATLTPFAPDGELNVLVRRLIAILSHYTGSALDNMSFITVGMKAVTGLDGSAGYLSTIAQGTLATAGKLVMPVESYVSIAERTGKQSQSLASDPVTRAVIAEARRLRMALPAPSRYASYQFSNASSRIISRILTNNDLLPVDEWTKRAATMIGEIRRHDLKFELLPLLEIELALVLGNATSVLQYMGAEKAAALLKLAVAHEDSKTVVRRIHAAVTDVYPELKERLLLVD